MPASNKECVYLKVNEALPGYLCPCGNATWYVAVAWMTKAPYYFVEDGYYPYLKSIMNEEEFKESIKEINTKMQAAKEPINAKLAKHIELVKKSFGLIYIPELVAGFATCCIPACIFNNQAKNHSPTWDAYYSAINDFNTKYKGRVCAKAGGRDETGKSAGTAALGGAASWGAAYTQRTLDTMGLYQAHWLELHLEGAQDQKSPSSGERKSKQKKSEKPPEDEDMDKDEEKEKAKKKKKNKEEAEEEEPKAKDKRKQKKAQEAEEDDDRA